MQFGTWMGNGERPQSVNLGFRVDWEAKDAEVLS